jgi:hypothetical protein
MTLRRIVAATLLSGTGNRLRLIALTIAVGVAASVGVPALAQSVTLRPGQYEGTSQLELPAGSPVKMPPVKALVCFTAEDVKNLSNKMSKNNANQDCKVIEQAATANGLKFTAECTVAKGAPVRMAYDVTFTSSESYRGVVQMTRAPSGGGGPQVPGSTFNVTAKRIGDCTK